MRARTFSDLVSGRAVSQSRIQAALACLDTSHLRRFGTSVKQLGELVVEAIPEALDIRLEERIAQGWLKAQKGAGPWQALLNLDTTAGLELPGSHGTSIDLRLDFALTLQQQGGRIEITDDGGSLLVGNGQAWRARWTLAVRLPSSPSADPFASGQCDVHLTPHSLRLPAGAQAGQGKIAQ